MAQRWLEKRAEGQRIMEDVVPGTGFVVRMDRGAWAATGGTKHGTWSWPRAVLQASFGIAAFVALGFVIDLDIGAYIGITLAYVFLIVRGHQVHRRYLARQSPSGP